jgi:hypothetical protein
LLREREAELDQLKSELHAKQRDDDRRFFVEEAIVFMEPAYGQDGARACLESLFWVHARAQACRSVRT